jgi:membrane-associated phospholipid phosphatase
MFEAEPILWLQGFASPPLTWLMRGVTLLGYAPVYAALVLLLAFVVRFRPALGVLSAVVLAATATAGLKNHVAFPRPADVDTRVVEPGDDPPQPVASRGAATAFWGLPEPEAIAAFRATAEPSYGFPSGHASAAAAFCLALAIFFHWRGSIPFALAWPTLMALSRVYLGRHFLADVLGGLGIGALSAGVVFSACRWIGSPGEALLRRTGLVAGTVLVLAAMTLMYPALDSESMGLLAGALLSYLLLDWLGFPSDAGEPRRRAARFAGAVLLYLAITRSVAWLLATTGWETLRLPVFVGAAVALSFTLVGGVLLARRLGWYSPRDARP